LGFVQAAMGFDQQAIGGVGVGEVGVRREGHDSAWARDKAAAMRGAVAARKRAAT
jgi:hypothetical protein